MCAAGRVHARLVLDMKALVKSKREPGLWLEEIPQPTIGINDVLIRVLPRRHLRNRPAHLQLGRMGAAHHSRSHGHRSRVRRRDRGDRLQRQRFPAGRYCQRRGPRGVRPLPQLPGRTAPPVRAHHGRGREPAGRVCRLHRRADDQHLAAQQKTSIWMSRRFSIPSAMRSIPRCPFRCWAKTC